MCYRCTALGKAFAVAPGQTPKLPLPLHALNPRAHFDFPFAQNCRCVAVGRGSSACGEGELARRGNGTCHRQLGCYPPAHAFAARLRRPSACKCARLGGLSDAAFLAAL